MNPGPRRVPCNEVPEAGGVGGGGYSTAVRSMEEAAIPADTAPENGRKCDEPYLCGLANGAVVLSGNVVAAQEHSSPVEGKGNNL